MTATFVPPTPNCGHGGVTFTHDVIRDLWICVKCSISLGGVHPRCSGCGGPLPVGALLTRFASRVCSLCQRAQREALRERNRR